LKVVFAAELIGCTTQVRGCSAKAMLPLVVAAKSTPEVEIIRTTVFERPEVEMCVHVSHRAT